MDWGGCVYGGGEEGDEVDDDYMRACARFEFYSLMGGSHVVVCFFDPFLFDTRLHIYTYPFVSVSGDARTYRRC